jgi:two-component system chemotaxis response regulator CheB
MPEGFTELFARRLDECCAIDVKEANSGDLLLAGRALICPGNRHMKVKRMPLGDIVVLSDEEKVSGHRPSVDVLYRSVAQEFGRDSVGLIMTGMGVYGMPRAAIERGNAMRVVPLDALANSLLAQCVERSRVLVQRD